MESLSNLKGHLQEQSAALDSVLNFSSACLLILFIGISFQFLGLMVMVRRNRKKTPGNVTITKGGRVETKMKSLSLEEEEEEEETLPCPHQPVQEFPSKELSFYVDISPDRPRPDIHRLMAAARPKLATVEELLAVERAIQLRESIQVRCSLSPSLTDV